MQARIQPETQGHQEREGALPREGGPVTKAKYRTRGPKATTLRDMEIVRRMHEAGATDPEIGAAIDSTREWVRQLRCKLGIKRNPPRRKQREAKKCPLCPSEFVGTRLYCSTRCANHGAMLKQSGKDRGGRAVAQKILALRGKMNNIQIAKMLGISTASVQKNLRKWCPDALGSGSWSAMGSRLASARKMDKEIRSLRAERKLTTQEIADKLGVSRQTVLDVGSNPFLDVASPAEGDTRAEPGHAKRDGEGRAGARKKPRR